MVMNIFINYNQIMAIIIIQHYLVQVMKNIIKIIIFNKKITRKLDKTNNNMLDRADIICLNNKAPDNINLSVVDLSLP